MPVHVLVLIVGNLWTV